MSVPAWAARYVGIPFREHGRDREAGLDCWGLAALIWREQYGLDVPSYAESYTEQADRDELAALVRGEMPGAWCEMPTPVPGDAVLLRVAGRPIHVGVVVAPPWFLHVLVGRDAVLERLDSPQWDRRVLGYYCHASRTDRAA